MAEKEDFYKVLGVEKTADEKAIKAAFKKIALKCHPDMVKNKSDEEKAEADRKFKAAREAQEVLTDPKKRAVYDKHGHKGLENMTSSTGTGQSYRDAAGETTKKKMPTAADAFDYFDRVAEREGKDSASGQPRESAAERRRKAAEERERSRLARRGQTAQQKEEESIVDDFRDAADSIVSATDRLKRTDVPVEDLELIREKAADLVETVDKAIRAARKNNRPSP